MRPIFCEPFFFLFLLGLFFTPDQSTASVVD